MDREVVHRTLPTLHALVPQMRRVGRPLVQRQVPVGPVVARKRASWLKVARILGCLCLDRLMARNIAASGFSLLKIRVKPVLIPTSDAARLRSVMRESKEQLAASHFV